MDTRRTINVQEYVEVDVDVNIDFDDYKDEFFAVASDEELLTECRRRRILKDNDFADEFVGYDTFKRYLCDLLGLGYFASKEEIIEEIKSKL